MAMMAASSLSQARAQDEAYMPAPDAPGKFRCVIMRATILPDRIDVLCANKGLNGLNQFSAETGQPYASAIAAGIVVALRSQVPLIVTYAPDAELNPPGCSARSCRKMIAIANAQAVKSP
jgi:hypothetical protein